MIPEKTGLVVLWLRLPPVAPGACLLLLLCLPHQNAHAWDDRWTDAKSGWWAAPDANGDKNNSDTGASPRPQHFVIPPAPLFSDVDPDELDDNHHKNYTPYALARITQRFNINGHWFPKGYYEIKPGFMGDGSPNTLASQVDTNTPIPNRMTKKQKKGLQYQVFVLKQEGKVITVVPIDHVEPYMLKKGEYKPKGPIAWMDEPDNNPPVLNLYYKKMRYSAQLQILPQNEF